MTRRKFVPALAAGGSLLSGAESKAPSIYEIRTIHLRNTLDNQRSRLTDFLQHAAVPAFARAGIAPCAWFATMIAEETPSIADHRELSVARSHGGAAREIIGGCGV